VAALALASGPLAGSLTGFWAGLALDVAPPGSHFVGQDALVFCLIGYACGLAANPPPRDSVPEESHTALFEIMVTAVAAVCGEALASLLGAMLSDPRVTWAAIKHVLPVAAVYDVLLCPFVLYAVAAALRLAGTPRRAGSPGRALAKREPRLKLGQGGSSEAGSLGMAFTGGGAAKVRFGTGRSGGVLGGSLLGGAAALNSHLAGPRLHSSRFGRSRMGRSLLGGSVFTRSPSALRSPSPARRAALMGRSSFLGRPGFLGRSPLGRSPLGRSPLGRSSASGLLGRVAAALRRPVRHPRRHQAAFRPPAGRRSAGRGWLRGSSLRRGPMRRGLAARRRMPGRRTAPARLHMRRSRFSRRRRTGGYR
jgi:rod shape-determining protein MreD